MEIANQWWGHSKEHGWVVLDRNLPANTPGLKENLVFFRCRDLVTYVEKRKSWVPPNYNFAPNYIRDLAPELSSGAAEEFAALKLRWPEFEAQIHKEQQDADDKTAVAVLEAEKARKEEVKEKKKAAKLAQTAT